MVEFPRHVSLLLTIISVCVSVVSGEFCSVKTLCANETTELDKWECYGRRIFRPLNASEEDDLFVEHQCESFGWGNSMRSLSVAGALAGALDARLTFKRNFRQFWDLPTTFDPDHTYTRQQWDYELLARNVSDFKRWTKRMMKPGKIGKKYRKKILEPGICAADFNIVQEGQCITQALPNFGKCVEYGNLNIPIFFLSFRKPASLMVKILRDIRRRLSLPQLDKDLEPYPGSWGLYTPGYYIVGFHVRMVPLGFEPLSVEYSTDSSLKYKAEQVKHFWIRAAEIAAKAQDVAKCRNEELLLYFATDDAENLRAAATERLGKYGRVVFGLKEKEVGHMSPHWTQREERSVDDELRKVRDKESSAEASGVCRRGTTSSDGTCTNSDGSLYVHTVSAERTPTAIETHAKMSLAEWWILANVQWLVGTTSSYSDVATAWGLGPGGHMERADLGGRVLHRIDWNSGSCEPVGSADPRHAKKCPCPVRF